MAKETTARYVIGTIFDDKGIKLANKSFDDLGKKARNLVNNLAALGAAAAAAGAAMVAHLVKAGIESIDTQAKLARSIGGTIDGLRGLQIAFNDAGVSNEMLGGAMQKFNARLGEAQRGSGEAKKALDILGISAQQLADMDVDQRMALVADRVKELGLSSSQTADILRDFGIRGGEMVDVLRSGGDAIRAARQEVDDFGLSVSMIDAAKVEAANDAMERIGRVMEGIRNQLAIAFAPMLQEIADRFNAVAKANNGFGSQAIATAEGIAAAFAKVADILRGLHVVAKGVELIFTVMGSSVVSVVQGFVEVFATAIDFITNEINNAIRGINKMGGSIDELPLITDSDWMKSFRQFGEESRQHVSEVATELHNLAMQDMPSTKVEAFFDAVKKRSQEAAAAMVADQPGDGTFVSPDEEADKKAKKDEERRLKELEAQREALVESLNQVIEFAAAEDDIENAQHETRLATLRESLEAELITEEEFQIAKQMLEEKHQAAMTAIQAKSMSERDKFLKLSFGNQVKFVAGYMADMTAGVSRENKAMFEINKIAGIANATVSTFQGMAKALEWGFPLGPIFAAVIGASGFAQIKAIASQHFGGGGGAAPSLAGGTPATPVTPVNGGTPQSGGASGGSLLTVEGISPDALFSGRTVRALAERLAEHQRDGGTVQFAG